MRHLWIRASIGCVLAAGIIVPTHGTGAEPLPAAFQVNGSGYYLVRLDIKAQTVFGLLFQQRGAWQTRFRPRDYALLR